MRVDALKRLRMALLAETMNGLRGEVFWDRLDALEASTEERCVLGVEVTTVIYYVYHGS